ncbi:unnamed protein product [Didymodactylos carnosus]|uniref:BRCT domain-containing protein n=1 Tax=Didymodactylos carnosus TaxID=1234261 RepID=A0A814NER2_9BILA|nr:unnamed protein product [Didymodactylos carnosus]CAF1092529.1 unnamed protein product [Didymodactylos carnosus]CAF3675078.1 unnamed protein product [Didymodactylos carnosus]CAF3857961.1 unnamed protein product [Didymodactylos carnosus]
MYYWSQRLMSPSTVRNGDIHVDQLTHRRYICDGLKWFRLCTRENCPKVPHKDGYCAVHFREEEEKKNKNSILSTSRRSQQRATTSLSVEPKEEQFEETQSTSNENLSRKPRQKIKIADISRDQSTSINQKQKTIRGSRNSLKQVIKEEKHTPIKENGIHKNTTIRAKLNAAKPIISALTPHAVSYETPEYGDIKTTDKNRYIWDGKKWQALCSKDECRRRQKSQRLCLTHFNEEQVRSKHGVVENQKNSVLAFVVKNEPVEQRISLRRKNGSNDAKQDLQEDFGKNQQNNRKRQRLSNENTTLLKDVLSAPKPKVGDERLNSKHHRQVFDGTKWQSLCIFEGGCSKRQQSAHLCCTHFKQQHHRQQYQEEDEEIIQKENHLTRKEKKNFGRRTRKNESNGSEELNMAIFECLQSVSKIDEMITNPKTEPILDEYDDKHEINEESFSKRPKVGDMRMNPVTNQRSIFDGYYWKYLCMKDNCSKRIYSRKLCYEHLYKQQMHNLEPKETHNHSKELNDADQKAAVNGCMGCILSKIELSSNEQRRNYKRNRDENYDFSLMLPETKRRKNQNEIQQFSSRLIKTMNEDTNIILTPNASQKRNLTVMKNDERKFVISGTRLTKRQKVQLQQFFQTLRGHYSIQISSVVDLTTTHLITNSTSKLVCSLTKKLFQAVVQHIFVVSYHWIDECLKQQRIIDERPYEIQGDKQNSVTHLGMRKSRLSKRPLFENCKILFWVECDFVQKLFTKEELIEMIIIAGGRTVLNASDLTVDNEVYVLCEKENIVQLKEKYGTSTNIHYVIPEWFLDSIVTYKILPHKLYSWKC